MLSGFHPIGKPMGFTPRIYNNARVAEEERLAKLAKKKAAVEKELRAEVKKINNLELYEKMAKEHPENPRLAELVKELKELEE